jgi:hypothetical protein
MKVTGSCHCGAITIEGEADPEKVTACHCTDCQTGTGSAFRVSVPIPGNVFKMRGQPTNYVKTTSESGNPRVQAFCPKCGSPIFSASPEPGPKVYMIRAGTIRQRDQFVPKVQLWARSKQRWVHDLAATRSVEKQ